MVYVLIRLSATITLFVSSPIVDKEIVKFVAELVVYTGVCSLDSLSVFRMYVDVTTEAIRPQACVGITG